ncbi:MAG: hypothetical protein WC817_00760 [Patescibacteria group bacterium]|jgi:hypothetical protein
MKKKYIAYALVPLFGFGFLGATLASAHGSFGGLGFGSFAQSPQDFATNQTARFEAEASLLGVSVDVIKQGWAEGKTLQDIATAAGITSDQLRQRVATAAQDRAKASLQALVDKGVITQAQADQRLKFMQDQASKAPQNGKGRFMHGSHRGGFHF